MTSHGRFRVSSTLVNWAHASGRFSASLYAGSTIESIGRAGDSSRGLPDAPGDRSRSGRCWGTSDPLLEAMAVVLLNARRPGTDAGLSPGATPVGGFLGGGGRGRAPAESQPQIPAEE